METVKIFIPWMNQHDSLLLKLFLTDQPRVQDYYLEVTCSVVFLKTCLSLTEFLLIVAHHSLVDNGHHYCACMRDKCNSSMFFAVYVAPFLLIDHYRRIHKFPWTVSVLVN